MRDTRGDDVGFFFSRLDSGVKRSVFVTQVTIDTQPSLFQFSGFWLLEWDDRRIVAYTERDVLTRM